MSVLSCMCVYVLVLQLTVYPLLIYQQASCKEGQVGSGCLECVCVCVPACILVYARAHVHTHTHTHNLIHLAHNYDLGSLCT